MRTLTPGVEGTQVRRCDGGDDEGLEALVSALSRVGSDGDSDQERVDQLAVLERVKSAVGAAQVRVTAAFVESQEHVAQAWLERARECSDTGDFDGWRAARQQARAASFDDDGVAAGQRSRRRGASGLTGVVAQVALARHESPVRGAQNVRLALGPTKDMPHTLAALEAGEVSEWRAQIIVTETATLTSQQRTLVDAEVVGPVGDAGGLVGRLVPGATVSSPDGSGPPRTASTLPRSWPAQPRLWGSGGSRSVPPPTRWPTSLPCSPSRRPWPRTPP
jgi:hypothetical protein